LTKRASAPSIDPRRSPFLLVNQHPVTYRVRPRQRADLVRRSRRSTS
jgi:hypothetical protein